MKRALVVALTASLFSLFFCRQDLGLIPHIADEISYVFQGRILASGRLWLSPPPVAGSMPIDRILVTQERWCSVYPPGWPLLLAAGWIVRAPWIINPLFLFLAIPGIYRLALRLFDRQTALLAIILFSISPFVLLMSGGFMSHPSTLCFAVWSAVFLFADRKKMHLFIAGFLGGFAFLIRPYTALTLLAPLFLWTVLRGEKKFRTALWLFLGLAPLVCFYLLYNQMVFGHPLQAGYPLDPNWHYKGPDIPDFFPKLAWFLRKLNHSVWGLPFGDLAVLLPLIFYRGPREKIVLLLLPCFTLLIGYGFYYYTDIVYAGPRFAYEMLGFFTILAAISVLTVARAVKRHRGWIRIAAGVTALALFLFPLAMLLPQEYRYHSENYHAQSARYLQLINGSGVGENALVLVNSKYKFVVGSFLFDNNLDLAEGGRVFLYDVPGRRDELRKWYPRSETWSVEIELDPMPGRNTYTDRFRLRKITCRQL